MTACISSGGGGAAAYSFELEKVKSSQPPSSSTTTRAATSSPSSTLSESSNSPLAISTRKPRTQRKRPNQIYNEAAALLSSVYPNIFSSNLSSSSSSSKQKTHSTSTNSHFYGIAKSPLLSDNDDASDLLLPYDESSIEEPDFLFNHHPTIQTKSEFFFEQKEVNSGGVYGGGGGGGVGGGEIEFDFSDEFDAESILDEEIEEGIDSIMGTVESNSNLGILQSRVHPQGRNSHRISRLEQMMMINSWNRNANEFKFPGKIPLGLGLRSALRENDESNSLTFQTVDFEQISPRIQTTATAITTAETAIVTVDHEVKSVGKKVIGGEKSSKKSSKKKKKMAILPSPLMTESKEETEEDLSVKRSSGPGPLLKLNYDGILKAWSNKPSPFSDDILGSSSSEATGIDVNARLAQFDLFGDSGMREASVLRYKEKRRTRLFSKKIRYEVRKLNADQRPRMKGRFVRRPNVLTPSGQR